MISSATKCWCHLVLGSYANARMSHRSAIAIFMLIFHKFVPSKNLLRRFRPLLHGMWRHESYHNDIPPFWPESLPLQRVHKGLRQLSQHYDPSRAHRDDGEKCIVSTQKTVRTREEAVLVCPADNHG